MKEECHIHPKNDEYRKDTPIIENQNNKIPKDGKLKK